MGIGWERQEAPGKIITMAVSPSRQLWALSQSKQIYYRAFNGKGDWQISALQAELQVENPYWLKVSVPLIILSFGLPLTI